MYLNYLTVDHIPNTMSSFKHTRDSPRHRFEEESDYDSSSDSESEGEIHCSGCNRDFVDSTALNQHRIYSPKHNWCFACSRDFSTADGLDKVKFGSEYLEYEVPNTDTSCSMLTPLPTKTAFSNVHSANQCSKALLESHFTSNPDVIN